MDIEKATDILKNIIADEVIGTYCIEIQKEGINCSENCKDEDCYLIQAIETVLNELDNKDKEIEELKQENLEIRDWKYVIDTYEDLDKLKELDLIKVKGKEYISKEMYNELEKDKKALVNNYSTILGSFVSKDNLKEIIYPTPENPISLEIQSSEMYKKLENLTKED